MKNKLPNYLLIGAFTIISVIYYLLLCTDMMTQPMFSEEEYIIGTKNLVFTIISFVLLCTSQYYDENTDEKAPIYGILFLLNVIILIYFTMIVISSTPTDMTREL